VRVFGRRTESTSVKADSSCALRDPSFAREFLLAAIDEGVDIQVALGKVIRAMGVKEFAAKVRMARATARSLIFPVLGSRAGEAFDLDRSHPSPKAV
jgi:hypothetical protein